MTMDPTPHRPAHADYAQAFFDTDDLLEASDTLHPGEKPVRMSRPVSGQVHDPERLHRREVIGTAAAVMFFVGLGVWFVTLVTLGA